jgi:flavin-binding protein dodecin
MPGHIYKLIDIVGTSEAGITEAVQAAVARASQTVRVTADATWYKEHRWL